MDRLMERRGRAGLSLVELLVVLAIIGVLTAVLVPVAVRNGWGTGSKTALAARDVFTLLKAARVYASTNNVETALVYGGSMVRDSDIVGNPCVPIVDSVLLARRLKRDEIIEFNETRGLGLAPSADVFIRVATNNGEFRPIPKDMTILPSIFSVDMTNPMDPVSNAGLTSIRILNPESLDGMAEMTDPANEIYLAPRFDGCDGSPTQGMSLAYTINSAVEQRFFPAHTFQPDGSLRVDERFQPQRIRFRVGARPDMGYGDRFHTNPDTDVFQDDQNEVFDAWLGGTASNVVEQRIYDGDADPDTDNYPEVDVWVELFVPTGRVKLMP